MCYLATFIMHKDFANYMAVTLYMVTYVDVEAWYWSGYRYVKHEPGDQLTSVLD